MNCFAAATFTCTRSAACRAGHLEAENEKGEEFGRSRLEELVAFHANDSPQEVANSVFARVARHSRGMEPFDDQSLVVIRT